MIYDFYKCMSSFYHINRRNKVSALWEKKSAIEIFIIVIICFRVVRKSAREKLYVNMISTWHRFNSYKTKNADIINTLALKG